MFERHIEAIWRLQAWARLPAPAFAMVCLLGVAGPARAAEGDCSAQDLAKICKTTSAEHCPDGNCCGAEFSRATEPRTSHFALLFGNNKYVGVSTLVNAENDARTMACKLKQQGYNTCCVLNSDLVQMRETLAAAREYGSKLSSELASAPSATRENARFVFYFAGHGTYRKRIDGNYSGYLLPSGKAELAKLEDTAFNIDEFFDGRTNFGGSLNYTRVILLDACRTVLSIPPTPIGATARKIASPQLFPTAAVDAVKTGNEKVFMWLSTKPGQPASDGTSSNQGLFVKMLSPELDSWWRTMGKISASVDTLMKGNGQVPDEILRDHANEDPWRGPRWDDPCELALSSIGNGISAEKELTSRSVCFGIPFQTCMARSQPSQRECKDYHCARASIESLGEPKRSACQIRIKELFGSYFGAPGRCRPSYECEHGQVVADADVVTSLASSRLARMSTQVSDEQTAFYADLNNSGGNARSLGRDLTKVAYAGVGSSKSELLANRVKVRSEGAVLRLLPSESADIASRLPAGMQIYMDCNRMTQCSKDWVGVATAPGTGALLGYVQRSALQPQGADEAYSYDVGEKDSFEPRKEDLAKIQAMIARMKAKAVRLTASLPADADSLAVQLARARIQRLEQLVQSRQSERPLQVLLDIVRRPKGVTGTTVHLELYK